MLCCLILLCSLPQARSSVPTTEKSLRLSDITDEPSSFESSVGESGRFTWWLPAGVEDYILPICGGVVIEASRPDLTEWLRKGSPYSLSELPTLGLRYGNQMLVVIVPWPHYAEVVIGERVGIRFSLPKERLQAAPCAIIGLRRSADPLQVAAAFRQWRITATNTGVIPRPRSLEKKIADLDKVSRLLGAPHFYLWGPALFSQFDVPKEKWKLFAKALRSAPPESFGGKLVKSLTQDQRSMLGDLSDSEFAMVYLKVGVAAAIESAMANRELLGFSPTMPQAEVIVRNKRALVGAFGSFLNPPGSWGDGLSNPMLDLLENSGVKRALLLLSDLHGETPRPDVVGRAEKLGFLIGPYDSYHSVHSPSAKADDTWETAQFDDTAYERGRVINAEGSAHGGFKGRGYHFSPQAAWPYVQQRVNRISSQSHYSAWFIDCDATAECFEDYSPEHPATMLEDTRLRRQRLAWLESEHHMVAGSEGGSVLFADVIHFGHGPQTPYIGHLDPSFKDPKSPYYIGRAWPADNPDSFFKSIPVPPSLKTPYFDPSVRIPLYRAALGDEIIATHHWSFDSLKFADVGTFRELLEILYMAPPMYHVNRLNWPKREERILRHLAFWGPLHQQLATAPLIRFKCLTKNRLLQQTVFRAPTGEASIIVNFSEQVQEGYPPLSATAIAPFLKAGATLYRAKEF